MRKRYGRRIRGSRRSNRGMFRRNTRRSSRVRRASRAPRPGRVGFRL